MGSRNPHYCAGFPWRYSPRLCKLRGWILPSDLCAEQFMTCKHKVFTSLSRRQRRARTQYIETLIHRERHRCGGLHYDDCEPVEGHNWIWSDILFLDKDSAT